MVTLKTSPFKTNKWLVAGAICLAMNALMGVVALSSLSTFNTLVFLSAAPIFNSLYIGIFERRMPTRGEWLFISVALACLATYFGRGITGDGRGILAGLMAGVALAGFFYFQRQLAGLVSPIGQPLNQTTILLGNLWGFIVLGVITFLDGSLILPTVQDACLIVGMGIFQTAIPMVLMFEALPKLKPMYDGFVPSVTAILSPVMTWALLGEQLPSVLDYAVALLFLTVMIEVNTRNKQKANGKR
jgi:drug/metabolite transporter (DMT)-like permease